MICSCQRKVLLILDVYDPSADIDPEVELSLTSLASLESDVATATYVISLQVLSLLKGDILEECSILMTCHQEQTTLLSSYFDRRLVNLGLDSAKQEQLIRRFSLLNHDSGEFRSRIWIHDEWNCSRVVYTIMPYQNRPVVCNNARLKSQSLEVEYHLASEISVILS